MLASCPWFPVVGNHEASDKLNRYLNSTFEQWAPLPIRGGDGGGGGGEQQAAARKKNITEEQKQESWFSTASSALGFGMSTGNRHAAASGGANPSGSSRYFSVRILSAAVRKILT